MIREVNGHFVISSRGAWVPGCYADWRAARYAFLFSDVDLQRLQDTVNPDGVITLSMLQDLHRQQVLDGSGDA